MLIIFFVIIGICILGVIAEGDDGGWNTPTGV
jgi:hypothetical protein